MSQWSYRGWSRVAMLFLFLVAASACADLNLSDQPGARASLGRKFSIAVVPDTQYFFDRDRSNPEVPAKAFQWIVDHTREKNIVFTVQLGDIVNNGLASELEQASNVFKILDDNQIQYAYSAGNHDINGSLYDSARGPSPYLSYFGPQRVAGQRSYCGATADGYNTCHTFTGGGQRFLLLALDWRASDATIAWAQSKLDEFPNVPTIITTHDLVDSAAEELKSNAAVLSTYGQTVWDRLIKSRSQIFLTLNGHFWPPAQAVFKNLSGREVHLHLVNYQDRFFGGSGMMRLYEFDLDAGTVDVQTFSPYWLSMPAAARSALGSSEVRLTDSADQFTMKVNFKDRFAPASVTSLPVVAAERMTIPGTRAYWRFEGEEGAALPESGVAVRDLSGHGNDLARVTLPGRRASDLTYTHQFHPAQPSRGSLFINGAYLRTADHAPLNGETFKNGYTFEAFVRLPEDCCGDKHASMGLLSRMGTGLDLGRHEEEDPRQPLVTLNVSSSREYQWAVAPFSRADLVTNWSFRTQTLTWCHIAVVNNGKTTELYINGSKDVRNSNNLSVGLQTTGEYWLVGATHYARAIKQSFYGWLGDIRIVDRPLSVAEFMISRDARPQSY